MSLDECLPAELRGPGTAITRIAGGLSGAGVYRVSAAGQAGEQTYVLKTSSDAEPVADWRRRVEIQRAAGAAGLAPRVVHTDEARRAVVTAFVADRGFIPRFADPRTRATAIDQLGRALRGVHDLPLPADAPRRDLRELIATVWPMLASAPGFATPAFVRDAVERLLAETPPPPDRAVVMSHNDVNPTNLAHDGERVVLLDWDTAGANDPLYDLAAAALFLRLDDATCLALLAAHDGQPSAALPVRFRYLRRFIAVLCGVMFLQLARASGHAGDATGTLESTPSLEQFYLRLRSGELAVSSAEGQWWFGLALLAQTTPKKLP
jgi:aminoglycoside phosphotransferase (APT) family kinase protein